jgi:predicted O-methyltransferase YrrM
MSIRASELAYLHPKVQQTKTQQMYEIMALDEKLDTHAHLPFLKEHAKGNVLEIGVHCGISTTALLAGLEENGGHLYSVDMHPSCRYVWYGHPQWTFSCPWSGDSSPEGTFDVAFIDGDHSYDAVADDLFHTYPKMNKGGIILCHDADTPSFLGVRGAIDKFCNQHGLRHELRRGSHGLEVIYV